MIVKRPELWGEIQYDTSKHQFSYVFTKGMDFVPYTTEPVLLNVDLTLKCNMDCPHCVAKDFPEKVDLKVSEKLIDWINRSPFLVVVITGGEPLLPEYESELKDLLIGIHEKGLLVDTNGTIFPSHSLIETIRDTNTLVRISWDAVRPSADAYFRQFRSDLGPNHSINIEYVLKKFDLIPYLQEAGVNVAAQTVLSSWRSPRGGIRDELDIMNMPMVLNEYSIRKWYIQKFIPSYKRTDTKYAVNKVEYDKITAKLSAECQKYNIECITKKDLRHNCVVLLIGKGHLYTQGQQPGQKIKMGTIDDPKINYSTYMSLADHADRYYG